MLSCSAESSGCRVASLRSLALLLCCCWSAGVDTSYSRALLSGARLELVLSAVDMPSKLCIERTFRINSKLVCLLMANITVHNVLIATVWQAGSNIAGGLTARPRTTLRWVCEGSKMQKTQEMQWQASSINGLAHTCRDSHSITASLYSFCHCCTATSCCC